MWKVSPVLLHPSARLVAVRAYAVACEQDNRKSINPSTNSTFAESNPGTWACTLQVVLKLYLSSGVVPSLNIAAGLLAFCVLHGWSWAAGKLGWTAGTGAVGAQECNVVQVTQAVQYICSMP